MMCSKIRQCYMYVIQIFCLTVPSASPEMFEAIVGQRQVVFSWSPPQVTQPNAVITGYNLSCSPSPSSLPQSYCQLEPLTVTGFSPNTAYSCSVVATNSLGSGPAARISFTMQQDCKCMPLQALNFSCNKYLTIIMQMSSFKFV